MTAEPLAVGPLEGLDNGTLHDLVLDCAEVRLDVHPARLPAFPHRDIAVPDGAFGLVDGIAGYGA
jgi:hypothetical protein